MDTTGLREHIPSVIGILIRRGADFASAEDAVQAALVRALETSDADPPRDPKAWLVRVAWRKFLDQVRSDSARAAREEWLEREPRGAGVPDRDDSLWLYFLCAHPSLTPASATALVAYVISAVFAAIGGALFVPVVGIISPADVGVVPSIMFLAGVAIGGRATMLGPVLGSIAVSWTGTTLSETFPAAWTYLQGALFILVVAFLPAGLAGLPRLLRGLRWPARAKPPAPPGVRDAEASAEHTESERIHA